MTTYPPGGAALHLPSTGDMSTKQGTQTPADATLHCFNVNTSATSAVTKIYSGPFPGGTPSSTGTLVATIDCSSATGRQFTYDIRCPGGIYMVQAAGGADVTLTYF